MTNRDTHRKLIEQIAATERILRESPEALASGGSPTQLELVDILGEFKTTLSHATQEVGTDTTGTDELQAIRETMAEFTTRYPMPAEMELAIHRAMGIERTPRESRPR